MWVRILTTLRRATRRRQQVSFIIYTVTQYPHPPAAEVDCTGFRIRYTVHVPRTAGERTAEERTVGERTAEERTAGKHTAEESGTGAAAGEEDIVHLKAVGRTVHSDTPPRNYYY